MRKGPVTQDWVHDIPFMQQTVLLTAIRGPDGVAKYHDVKYLLRWYRRCVLLSAMDARVLETPFVEGGGSFTGVSFGEQHELVVEPFLEKGDWWGWMDRLLGEYLRSVDELPHHFQLHFLHAAEIVGFKHPETIIRGWWQRAYQRLVHDMHLWPETQAQLDARLGDSRAGWLARNDEATTS